MSSTSAQKARRRERIFARDGHCCRKCGSTEDLTVDHIWPRAWGGTGRLANLQTLCRECNERKGSAWPEGESPPVSRDGFPTTRLGELLDAVL